MYKMYKVITGKLKARTAIHIGNGQGNDVTDALIRRDAYGQPYIPGTSIAGVLRFLLTRLAPRLGFKCCNCLSHKDEPCQCEVCHLFGDINPSDKPESKSAVSRLVVFDARAEGPEPQTIIRDGVGIERVTGAAARAAAAKFDLEVVTRGSEFELRMELHNLSLEDEMLLAAGLTEWEAGRLWLGGRVARGLGAFDLSNIEYKTLDLGTSEGLLNYLNNDQPWREATVHSAWHTEKAASLNFKSSQGQPKTVLRGWFKLDGVLQAEEALLANDSLAAGISGFHHAPLLANLRGWKEPVIPGAGLRGVLRSHAERLARTLVTYQTGSREDFLLRCPVCDPNARSKDGGASVTSESCDSLLRRIEKSPQSKAFENDNDLTDSSCLACRLFGSPRRGSRLIIEDAPYKATPRQKNPEYKMMDFLAIDRFTGGSADKLKFDALALWKPAFDFRIYLENPEPWELGWLWLILRDLAEGWLKVGFGGAKGLGCVKLVDWRAKFGYFLPEDIPDLVKLGLTELSDGVYRAIEITETVQGYETVIQQWIDEFHREIQSFFRPEQMKWSEDSYFGVLDELYPLLGGGYQ